MCGSTVIKTCKLTHGQDLALLGRLWAAALDWDELYAGWKDCAFSALDVGVMQSAAARIGCTLQDLAQDIQAWPALEWIQALARFAPALAPVTRVHLTLPGARAAQRAQDQVASFLQTMPLIANMRSPALRPRHWRELEERINARADPNDAAFSLEVVLSLRLDQHAALISALATTATKELGVEMTLEVNMHVASLSSADTQCMPPAVTGCLLAQGIARTWAALPMDLAEHKGIYRVRGEPFMMTPCIDSGPAHQPSECDPSRCGALTRYLLPWRTALWRCRP